jgi:hypothetical protein
MRGYRNPKKGEYGFEYLTKIKCMMSSHALDYLQWMQVRNYSPATIHGRMKDLAYFIAWSIEHGLNDPVEITKPIIERYQKYLYHYKLLAIKHGQPDPPAQCGSCVLQVINKTELSTLQPSF